jgi:hypothetical protein
MTKKSVPLSDTKSKSTPVGCMVLFFSIFLAAGCAFVWAGTGAPVFKVLSARSWVERSALVLSSEVREHHDDGTSYSVEIRYSYRVDGRLHESSRYSFFGSYMSRRAARETVERYSVGSEVPCWVNPGTPEESVLDRELGAKALIGLFGLVFVAVGGGGIGFALRVGKKPAAAALPSGPQVLTPLTSPAKSFWGILAFSLVWNVFIALFIGLASASEEKMPLAAKLVLGAFAVAGILMLWGTWTSLKKLLLPWPKLTLPRGMAWLGQTGEVQWTFTGRVGTLRSLSMVLEGREEAQFRQGTETLTEKSVFFRKEIVSTGDPLRLRSGATQFSVPGGLVPSLAGDSNKIVWVLRVVAGTDGSEQIEAEFPFIVGAGTREEP